MGTLEKEYLKKVSDKNFATIDTETVEIVTLLDKDFIEKNNYSTMTINAYQNDLYRVKLNVHCFDGRKYPFDNLKDYLAAKKEIMENIKVITYANKRLDLCIDSMRNFEKTKKLSNIIVGLLGIEFNEKEVILTKNLYDLKTRSYIVKNRDIEVCIYDKRALEEDYPYNTRIELKMKRVPKNSSELEVIKAMEIRLKNSLNHFEELESLYIKLICNKIMKAKEENKFSNFKAFVNYNEDLFLTKKIFDGVFFYVGLKQPNNWLRKYRQNSFLEFESKDSLIKQHKVILKAIVKFRGNFKDWNKINKARIM